MGETSASKSGCSWRLSCSAINGFDDFFRYRFCRAWVLLDVGNNYRSLRQLALTFAALSGKNRYDGTKQNFVAIL